MHHSSRLPLADAGYHIAREIPLTSERFIVLGHQSQLDCVTVSCSSSSSSCIVQFLVHVLVLFRQSSGGRHHDAVPRQAAITCAWACIKPRGRRAACVER